MYPNTCWAGTGLRENCMKMASLQYAFSMGRHEIVPKHARYVSKFLYSKVNEYDFKHTQKVRRRSEQRRLAAARGSIDSDRYQRLSKLKSVTELFQMFDMDGKRFVAERFGNMSFSQEGSLPLQVPLSQELPVYPISPSLDVPVCIEHFFLLEHPLKVLPFKAPLPPQKPPSQEPPLQELQSQEPLPLVLTPQVPPSQELPVYPISPLLDVPVCIELFFSLEASVLTFCSHH